MDTQALLIGAIMMIICITPILILSRSGSKSVKQYLNSLNELAAKSNTDISDFDHWNTKAIGINSQHSIIFYLRKTDFNDFPQQVNLSEVQKCKVVKSIRDNGDKNNKNEVISKIELVINKTDKRLPEVVIDFFNIDEGSLSYDEELKLAEKWAAIINDKIKLS